MNNNLLNIKKNFKFIIMFGLMIFALVNCGNKGGDAKDNAQSGNGDKKIKIVTTTTMLADLSRIIGGDKVEVEGLMGEGVDPHLYTASAGDVDKLSKADLIVYGGLHLEGKMTEVFESMEQQKKAILNVGDAIDKSQITMVEGNTPDPHVWFNTEFWGKEAEALTNKLAEMDAKNADYYKQNYENYKKELAELTEYVKGRINEIPEKSRVLVTAHDAFGYFGKQFGLEVKAIQGVSTDSETGTKNISDLANFIVERDIKAIFVESSVPKKSIEALQEAVKAKGKEIKIGGELYSDSLGDKEHNTESYIKTVKANADTIANALK